MVDAEDGIDNELYGFRTLSRSFLYFTASSQRRRRSDRSQRRIRAISIYHIYVTGLNLPTQ